MYAIKGIFDGKCFRNESHEKFSLLGLDDLLLTDRESIVRVVTLPTG